MSSLRATLESMAELIRDRVAIWCLRREIVRAKAAKYDELVANMVGLRRAISTYQSMVSLLQADLEASHLEVDNLRSEYTALNKRAVSSNEIAHQKERLAFFRKILPVIIQIPTMRTSVTDGASLESSDVLDILRPLDQTFADMGFERIGEVGQEIAFDPTRHRVVDGDPSSTQPQDRVLVRFIGYALEGEILAKADVARVIEPETA